MKALLAVLLAATPVIAQDYPHAFPREGANQVFDNERVTIWDVTWLPGKPSPMHRHKYDLVGVYLVGSPIKVTMPDGTSRESKVEEGFVLFQSKGVTHIEEGMVAENPRHAILIDLKDHVAPKIPNETGLPLAFPREGAVKRLENDRVAIWEYLWTKTPSPMHFHDKDVVVVVMEGGEIESTTPDGKSRVTRVVRREASFTPGNRAHSEHSSRGPPAPYWWS
jgi:predicted metal-dependent enzyme (double-stranded beta helix superfamily)